MRILVWLFRAFIFFSLFAFSLNNQQSVALHWFFGYAWTAPLVIIVLAAFTAGVVIGVLALTPSWWRHRRRAQRLARPAPSDPAPAAPVTPLSAPPVDGL